MEKFKNFAFILLLIQLSSDFVFCIEDELMDDFVYEQVNDVCATIDECKFECCQLNRLYSLATNQCSAEHIDKQLSDVNLKSAFSAGHHQSCQLLCSHHISTQEMVREEQNFQEFIRQITSRPGYLCANFAEICYSYSVTQEHWKSLNAMESFRHVVAPVIQESLSILFLSVTLLLYLAVPNLCRRIQDKCFLLYLGFRIAYFCTRLMLVFSQNKGSFCRFSGFMAQFSGLAAAFWLNIICFHLWVCMNYVIPSYHSDRRTIFHYSLYACGCSLLITVVTHMADIWLPDKLESFKPHIAEPLCSIAGYDRHSEAPLWFQPQFIYYFSFQTILQIINLCAFLHIVYILLSKKNQFGKKGNETYRRHHIQKVGIFTYVKLFLLMGLTTILELISFHFGTTAVEKLSFRPVSAFLLFVIFVCNKRVWHLTKKRISELSPSQSSSKIIGAVGYRNPVTERTRVQS